MQDIIFYILAFLTLFFGFLVVANPFSRNPVTSAMFLVLTIVSMAGLFVLLHAFFLAAVQIIVYAGAVIVLFLFVIMLLDLKDEERRVIRKITLGLASLSIAALTGLIGYTLWKDPVSAAGTPEIEGSTAALGMMLFSSPQYLLPFEMVSLLLLVAMVGVILLSKRNLK